MNNEQIHHLSQLLLRLGTICLIAGVVLTPIIAPALLPIEPLSWSVSALLAAIGGILIGAAFWIIGRIE